jgi:alanine dehydrogenase
MALLLSRNEIQDLITMEQAIRCTERVFLEQMQGRVNAWAPFVVGHDNHELRVNAGALAGLKRAGLRFSMKGAGMAALYDTENEVLLCLMAYPWTYMRVGATVALSVRALAKEGAKRLLIIGTGRISRASLHGISCVGGFKRVQVYSRQASNRQKFCEDAKRQFSVDTEPVTHLETAVGDADVVVIATSAEGPVLRFEWLAKGTHISSAGIRCEIDEEIYLNAERVYVGSKVHEQNYVGWIDETNDNTLVRLTREGRLSWAQIAELGEIIGSPLSRPPGITVFRESQGGFGDIALAQHVYEEAKKLGKGTSWNINS